MTILESVSYESSDELILDGASFSLASHAVVYLQGVFAEFFSGRTWPIEGYEILIKKFPLDGYATVSFCPKIEHAIDGVPFEVSDNGVWKNGPGVKFFIALSDLSLMKTQFMR